MPAKPGSKADRDLIRLVYVSAAASTLTTADFDAIAASAEARNCAAAVTGLLLHQGRSFYGVLEGPRRRVFERMERIITDPRHTSVKILLEADVTARRFENWSFGALPTVTGSAGRAMTGEDFIRTLSRRLK